MYIKKPRRNLARNAAIIARYLQLRSIRLVGQEFGLTHQAISSILRKNNIETKRASTIPEYVDRLLTRCQEVKNVPKVAAEFGLTPHQVHWRLRQSGVQLRPRMNSPEELFWSKVDRKGADECWEWQAAINKGGYGTCHFHTKEGKNEVWTAHRIAWYITHGNVPALPLGLLHKCGIRKCCNPSHLRIGTRAENAFDRTIHRKVGYGAHAVKYFV